MKYKEFKVSNNEGTMEFFAFVSDLSDPDLATSSFRQVLLSPELIQVNSINMLSGKFKLEQQFSTADYVSHCFESRPDPCNSKDFLR